MKALLVLILFFLTSCAQDNCKEYSEFTCDEIEKANYNVYFYYPDGKENFLGSVNGLGACGNQAHSFANTLDLSQNDNWSYVCCMRANGSECLEKHR